MYIITKKYYDSLFVINKRILFYLLNIYTYIVFFTHHLNYIITFQLFEILNNYMRNMYTEVLIMNTVNNFSKKEYIKCLNEHTFKNNQNL